MQVQWTRSLWIALFLFSSIAQADPLAETSALLLNPAARAKVIEQDAKAKNADVQVKSLGLTPAKEEQVYQLSAKIFETLALKEGGDPEKLNAKVQELLRDPASLSKEITSEQQAEIKNIASP